MSFKERSNSFTTHMTHKINEYKNSPLPYMNSFDKDIEG